MGLLLGGSMAVAGIIPIPVPLAGWIAIYGVLWIAIFLALKRGLVVLIVMAFLTGGFILLATQHLIPKVPNTSAPTTTPAD